MLHLIKLILAINDEENVRHQVGPQTAQFCVTILYIILLFLDNMHATPHTPLAVDKV